MYLDWPLNLITSSDNNEYQVYKALICLKTLVTDWKIVRKIYE